MARELRGKSPIMKKIILCCFVFGLLQCQSNRPQAGAISQFESYFEALNEDTDSKWKFRADTLRVWFEDQNGEPVLNIKGQTKKGKWSEWDKVMHSTSSYDSIWYDAKENAVEGFFYEQNDFYRLIGKPATKTKRTYWFNGAHKISDVLIVWLPEENQLSDVFLEPIVAWAQEHDSTLLQEIYPEGKIAPSAENARKWKALIKRYRAAQAN